ncbi:polysaccharide pyruvyl transferase family protein [Stakelama tenebrarum]|uniref:Polysaccharide pyruvyl transferase family protein n=1 Tax=Stakelama tenebrarum TaxID=2711215 RepID=A0A6G6Y3R8_9SPHN|nr:polysaccharide pyruvyl transferase family protein [Sphingosinithalassobacter tenebrarum]QIG79539.1 polysaccharide pyruvyl transferase family protein [Sphingosinithalassobacter tenebrarum]
MRLTFLADNSTSPNWGCRATSFALRELLSTRHEIVATIDRALLSAPFTSDARISGEAHWNLVRRLRRKRLRALPLVGPAAFGAIDAIGAFHAPSHDIAADAELLWEKRDVSPKASRIVAALDPCDAVVVNAEGETIFSTPERPTLLQTLAICALAKRMGKRVYWLNGMVSGGPDGGINQTTLAAFRAVMADATFSVRDPRSADLAAEILPEFETPYYPDALFGWSHHFADIATAPYDASRLRAWFDRTGTAMPASVRAPYMILSGSSLSARDPARAADCYTALAQALRVLGVPILLVETCIGDVFLRDVAKRTGLPLVDVNAPIMAGAALMANARLFVSGRWHPGIMAALGGTPSVFMGSNSHKTFSLQTMLGYADPVEYDAFPSDADIAGIVARSRQWLEHGTAMRGEIAGTAARLAEKVPGLLSRFETA